MLSGFANNYVNERITFVKAEEALSAEFLKAYWAFNPRFTESEIYGNLPFSLENRLTEREQSHNYNTQVKLELFQSNPYKKAFFFLTENDFVESI